MKKHIPLIVGIAMPVVFILVLSLVIFIPSLSIRPKYNFLYSMDDDDGYTGQYQNTYAVENGQLTLEPTSPTDQNQTYKPEPPLYLYDVATNSSQEVSFDDATGYKLDPGPSSPDGFTVQYEYGNYGIFDIFGGENGQSGYFIEKGDGKKELTGLSNADQYSYGGDLKFIGWIQ